MAKFSLDKFFEVLFKIDPKTNDFELEPDEYVRVVAIKGSGKEAKPVERYFKTKKEISEFAHKYKYNYNIYITLSTTKGKCGNADSMYRRQVLMLDYDKKDYPEYSCVADFSKHIKARMPLLFNHMIIDTGYGYHFYIATNSYRDTARMANVNKQLANILGADPKATLSTQIARLPTTFNVKDRDDYKRVVIVANNLQLTPDKFRRYNLQKIEGYIEKSNWNKSVWEQVTPLVGQEYKKESRYYCIEAMLAEGVNQSERNFSLGRIVKYLQIVKGYTKFHALQEVQTWNLKCNPPKPPHIIESDFNRYWDNDYNLLGCYAPDTRGQKIIDRFCLKHLCKTIEDLQGNVKADQLYFDNNILKNTIIRELTGNHYMILSVLDYHKYGLTKKQLTEQLTNKNTKKCCISRPSLDKYLKDLIKRNYVSYNHSNKIYTKTERANYGAGYTKYSYNATLWLINRIIKPKQYLVYLCLIRNLYQDKNVTYETLASDLNLTTSNIGTYIRSLSKSGVLIVEKNINHNGRVYNVYRLVA